MFSLTQAVMGSATTTADGAPAEEGEGGEVGVSKDKEEEEDTTTTATPTSLWGSATAALGSWGDVASSLVKPSDPDAEEELCENLENSIKQAESAALGAVTSIFGTLSEAANTASLATLTEAVASASGGTNIFELDKLQEEERKKDARKQRIQESLDYYLEKYPTCSEATYEEWIEYYLANYEGAWDHDANADAEADGNAEEKKIDDSYYAEASVHRNLWNRRIYEDSNGGNDPKRSYVEAKDKKKDDNKEDKNKGNKKAIRTKDGALVDEKDEEIVFVPSDEDAEEGKEKEESAATGAKKENTETTDATTAEEDKGATKDDSAPPPQEELETKSVEEDVVVVVPKKAAAAVPAPSAAKTEPTKPAAAASEGLDSDLDDLLS